MVDARDAVARLVFAYAERLDAGDFAGVGELFAHATYRSEVGGSVVVFTGADDVRQVIEGIVLVYEDGTPRTKHVTTNLVIDVDEAVGTATARSYFLVLQATSELPLQVIAAGRYEDVFTRVDGEWRFSDRLIYFELAGDMSRHLRTNPL